MDDDLDLRPGGAIRGKQSIFGWDGRGVVCDEVDVTSLAWFSCMR
jgi:hypothetical protein